VNRAANFSPDENREVSNADVHKVARVSFATEVFRRDQTRLDLYRLSITRHEAHPPLGSSTAQT